METIVLLLDCESFVYEKLEGYSPVLSASQRISCHIVALSCSIMILWKQMHNGKNNIVVIFSLSKHCRHF